MTLAPPAGGPARCPCGTELAPALLACPSCHRLVHAGELARLAGEARAAEERAEWRAALAHWRQALELLPADSRQAATIAERVAGLRERAGEKEPGLFSGAGGGPKPGTRAATLLAPLGVLGLLLWKFKFVVVLVLSKAKFLLFGLTKAGSATSILLSLGVYWAAFGWPLALGLVVSLYLHELGHVAAMARLGMKLEPPMFVPGVGAFVRLRQRPVDALEDARIGLAGPIWGLGAALLAFALGRAIDAPVLLAIARLGAWLNLFNLLPVWQLDGGRAFRALDPAGRALVAVALAAAWWFTREGLLVLLLLVAVVRSFKSDARSTDKRTLVEFVGLIAALSALAAIPVATP